MDKGIVSNNTYMGKERNVIYLEVLRLIACFLVVFNHTDGYHLFLNETIEVDGLKTLIHMSVSMLTKINVPIFLMISGAVLLGKQESFQTLFRKRILKIVMVIWVFSFIKYTYANGIFNFDLYEFVTRVIQGEICGPYWYLYAYLGSLCMLPFIRSIAQNMTGKQYVYLLFWCFMFASVRPIIGSINEDFVWSGDFGIVIATAPCIFYLLMGYGINKYYDVQCMTWKKGITCTVIVCICIAVEIFYTITNRNSEGFYTQNYVQMFDYLIAIYVFVLAKCIFVRINISDRVKWYIGLAGSLTFGIYLLDPITPQKIIDFMYNNFGSFTGSFIYCIFSMFLYGTITYVWKICLTKLKRKIVC